jgi:DNA-binding MarR family transcriptional regulator
MNSERRDFIDDLIGQWKRERPDVDASLMAVPGRIRRISRLVERRLVDTWSRFGLARGGFDVLAALRRAGPPHRLSPTELYSSLLLSSGAMTNRIDRLAEAGLVVREPDPEDRRGVLVCLTPKGKALVDEAVVAVVDTYRDLFSPLTPEEWEILASLLRKVLGHLWTQAAPPPEGVGEELEVAGEAGERSLGQDLG